MGPLPVAMAWTKNPNMENMARRPFLISLTCSITSQMSVACKKQSALMQSELRSLQVRRCLGPKQSAQHNLRSLPFLHGQCTPHACSVARHVTTDASSTPACQPLAGSARSTFSSEKVSGSSARPRGSKGPPG